MPEGAAGPSPTHPPPQRLTHGPGLRAHNVHCKQLHPRLLPRLPPHSLLNRLPLQAQAAATEQQAKR